MATTEEMLHKIDTKISKLCVKIDDIKEDTKENKEGLKELNRKLDLSIKDQKDFCFQRSLVIESGFKKRPTFGVFISILVLFIGIATGSYIYTNTVSNRVEANHISIHKNSNECDKLKDRIDLHHLNGNGFNGNGLDDS